MSLQCRLGQHGRPAGVRESDEPFLGVELGQRRKAFVAVWPEPWPTVGATAQDRGGGDDLAGRERHDPSAEALGLERERLEQLVVLLGGESELSRENGVECGEEVVVGPSGSGALDTVDSSGDDRIAVPSRLCRPRSAASGVHPLEDAVEPSRPGPFELRGGDVLLRGARGAGRVLGGNGDVVRARGPSMARGVVSDEVVHRGGHLAAPLRERVADPRRDRQDLARLPVRAGRELDAERTVQSLLVGALVDRAGGGACAVQPAAVHGPPFRVSFAAHSVEHSDVGVQLRITGSRGRVVELHRGPRPSSDVLPHRAPVLGSTVVPGP